MEAGADMIFPEAMTERYQYREFVSAVNVPVLANITELGTTPLFTTRQLSDVGVSMVLYLLGHRRAEGIPLLKEKFKRYLRGGIPENNADHLLGVCLEQETFESTSVDEMMSVLRVPSAV